MKKVGIIGGMGSLASAHLYELIVKMTDAKNDQEQLELVIHNYPAIYDRTDYILGKSFDNPIYQLLVSGNHLMQQGCNIIGIPCVTAHYFYDLLKIHLDVDIINVIDETVQYLKRKHISKVGLMATDGTIQTGIFQRKLEKNDIDLVIPDELNQRNVMHMIYDDVKSGNDITISAFNEATTYLQNKNAQAIILGCTDLSIVKKELNLDSYYVDCLEILSYAILTKCHKDINSNYAYLN
ncbi:MAG: amino acid racemase [Erysipelotrichaceae bacterium]|nr:amino acid racemase [Erysipelotrichaceae bacterium]